MSVSRMDFKGHGIWANGTSVTPYQPGLLHFILTLQSQTHNGLMVSTRSGLISPRQGAQYGDIYSDLMEWAIQHGAGRSGSCTVVFFQLMPNGEFS